MTFIQLAELPAQENLPSLHTVLDWATGLPFDDVAGYANDCADCPLAHCLEALIGGEWIVGKEELVLLYLDQEGHLQQHRLSTPGQYRAILELVDDPTYREGDPQQLIPALTFAEMVRTFLKRRPHQPQVGQEQQEIAESGDEEA
jgi:hypothetical protein